nr:pentapeptide repeat-containing protein [Lentilactobacillus otakiensis]
MATITKQTLSLDDVEPDNEYLNCTFTVSNELIRINDVVFDHCKFEQSNFDRSDWGYVEFKGCDFLNATFHKSYLSNCKFTNVQLMGADLSMETLVKKMSVS